MAPNPDGDEHANPGQAPPPPADGMNAKERRAAKRKAEQSQDDDRDSLPVAASRDIIHPAAQVVNGMNAKERRAAKRAAERAAGEAPVMVLAVATAQPARSSNPADTGAESKPPTNAKERRAAKRAAAREHAAARSDAIASSTGSNLDLKTSLHSDGQTGEPPTNAKERRAAKRAAARERAAAEPMAKASPSTQTACTGTGPSKANLTGTTAKERRLLRREQERDKRERETQSADTRPRGPRAKRQRTGGGHGGRVNPHIVFVGQLAFSTSAKDVEEHFRTRGGIEGNMTVRLLTQKGSNPPRSKGMAFIEVGDAETTYLCLGLHHSRLHGRLINVERTSGGGKGKKGGRIQEKREEQKEFMKSVVQRVLDEFIDAGRLGKDELDDAAKSVLLKMEAKVVERVVKDYCDKPDRLELHNPSAWFTHHAHELAFRADHQDLDAGARDWLNDERVKAAGRKRDRDKAAKKPTDKRGRPSFGTRGTGKDPRMLDVASGEKVGRDEDKEVKSGMAGTDEAGTSEQGNAASVHAAEVIRPHEAAASASNVGEGSSQEYAQEAVSGLASIFTSLRGRGGGRVGSMAGRGGGGGRGFRQGGIRA